MGTIFNRGSDLYVGTTDSAQTDANGDASYGYLSSNVALGVNNFLHKNNASQNAVFSGYEIATPIHTSSHYQTFETPLLHELVGGDRNMEQHNLVCSPDGKTWDQITRDTSYIGNGRVLATTDTYQQSHSAVLVMDEHRGTMTNEGVLNFYNKDFAIAYDRFICLKAGTYKITANQTTNYAQLIKVNGKVIIYHDPNTGGVSGNSMSVNVNLVRGDYVQKFGGNQLMANQDSESSFLIEKV